MSGKSFHIIAVSLLLLLLAVSAWSAYRGGGSVISGQAASIGNILLPLHQESGEYVALSDIIAASLERIKKNAATGTSTANKTLSSASAAPASPTASPSDLADAIVNIFCTQKTDQYNRSISGTGFMINPKGVILTNAHVAQFLLLEGSPEWGETVCQARTGNNATTAYNVELLYISPSWIIENASIIAGGIPRGTGENDFALLYVTGKAGGGAAAGDFAFIPPSTNPLSTKMHGETVIIVGYPSEEDRDIEDQVRAVATTTITQLYTFESGLADVFSLAASPLGHQGVSGGPVIDHLGRAIGVISTKEAGTTVLHAITTSYIDRSMRDETGFDLASTLQGNLPYRAKIFNETVAPILQELLTEQIR